ncbi:monovalent cation/H+ antiporter complex subunit F [Amaricoccus solimangrovi]|uniref:Multiple resistance and pH regulation protein F n=1 Tax=Amaricoccus solimangrovi TaxID=2589815 RepID=A0A501WYR4_9RHOB|nr:monovalent cation/H+ antiporter complex subunit F [Amaricoccus solimangrovi]TPE52181.1 multiple resistance and pH regulation protein F [Amaricoccus solimangrovi]
MMGIIIDTEVGGVLGAALELTVLCVAFALAAAVYRLLRGPTLADRVVALDMISVLLVVFLVAFRMVSGVDAYMFVAIGLALIAFLATVAFAGYIDRARGDQVQTTMNGDPGHTAEGGAGHGPAAREPEGEE